MYSVNKLVTVIVLHVLGFVVGELYKGDICYLKNGNSGICKLIVECPEAIGNIRKGIFPQQCSFEGSQVIVCCAVKAAPQTTPGTTTTTTPTTTTTTPTTTTTTPTTTTKASTTTTKTTTTPRPSKERAPGDIAKQKCLEYSKYVWTLELNPTLLINAGNIRRNECPFNHQELIVGGDPATRREFPHMVQFGYDASEGLKWTCGGSLISEQFILTAAHCLSDRSFGDAKYARMGIVDLEDDNHIQQYNIIEIKQHPQYQEPSHYHDIGLAKIHKPADLNTWVRPACLYTRNQSPWSKVIASGWGKTDYALGESSILLRVILELYDQPRCNKTFKQVTGTEKLQTGIKDDIMICAGHSVDLKDTCQGDSGGPLQVYSTGNKNLSCMYDVVGITSFGIGCGLAVNAPAVYTRVSYYVKWIEDIVWPLS